MKFVVCISLIGLLLSASVAGTTDLECRAGPPLKNSEILVGYARRPIRLSEKTGSFNALAIIEDGNLRPTHGNMIRNGMRFSLPLGAKHTVISLSEVSAYVERLGVDHCVYHGDFKEVRLPDWTIVSTRPLDRLLKLPTPSEISRFYELDTRCVDQGDYDPDEAPPCVKPQLIAVSDIDQDGNTEYWHTDPYLWDTGFAISEEREAKRLHPLIAVCPGCSD